MGKCPWLTIDYSRRIMPFGASRYNSRGNKFSLPRDSQAKGGSNEGIVILMSQNQDSFSTQFSPCTSVSTGALHEVVLLSYSCQFCTPDDSLLYSAEQFICSCLAVLAAAPGVSIEDAITGVGIETQKEILCERRVLWP